MRNKRTKKLMEKREEKNDSFFNAKFLGFAHCLIL